METIDNVIEKIFDQKIKLDSNFLNEIQAPNETIEKIRFLKNMVSNLHIKEQGIDDPARLFKASGEDTFVLISALKESLKDSLKNGKLVQNLITWMFSLTFILGFVLIAFATYFGTVGEPFLAIAFGAFGMASIVTLLVKDPPLKMQDSRSNYAQLSIGIIAWLNDLVDKGVMSSQNQLINALIQDDKNIMQDVKREANKESVDLYLSLSNAQINNTIKLLKIIDKVAEPGTKYRDKSEKQSKKKVNEEEQTS